MASSLTCHAVVNDTTRRSILSALHLHLHLHMYWVIYCCVVRAATAYHVTGE